MKQYYVEGIDNKDIYSKFVRIMLCYSEAFSLVYYRRSENERVKHSTKDIKKRLAPYKIYSKNVSQWPGTVTRNLQNHIYQLCVYRSDNADWGVIDTLEKANSIWEWDYPKFPMDLAFYRKGYAWFSSTAHEHLNQLYLSEETEKNFLTIRDLKGVGIELTYETEVDDSTVYYDERAKLCK